MDIEKIQKDFNVLEQVAKLNEDFRIFFEEEIARERFFFKTYLKKNKTSDNEFITFLNLFLKLRITSNSYKWFYYREKRRSDDIKKMKPEIQSFFKRIFQ